MACLSLIIIGVAATIWGGPWEVARPIAKDLGPGIFTAGLLASLVEPFFRREFARDAFLAAFRYVLPHEFREEVEKILKFDLIGERQLWTVKVEKVTEDTVFVTTSIERVVRNKTKENKSLNTWYQVNDYRFPEGRSKIIECGIEVDAKKEEGGDPERKSYEVGMRTREVVIPPDKTARLWSKATQYRRVHGDYFETFRQPIVDPEIEVLIDENEFEHIVQFGTHGDVTKAQYGNRYKLSGVYFPGQFMIVRWWPKQEPVLDLSGTGGAPIRRG
jgi:hypothetical protein